METYCRPKFFTLCNLKVSETLIKQKKQSLSENWNNASNKEDHAAGVVAWCYVITIIMFAVKNRHNAQ